MLGVAITATASSQSLPSATGPATIVLVHGALIDGSSWRGVFEVLTKDGYQVSVAQPPLTGATSSGGLWAIKRFTRSRSRDDHC
jgi:hypothetical protein